MIAIVVSPRTNMGKNPLSRMDGSAYELVNNSHYSPLNLLMVYSTLYGRETFWPAAMILLFVFGGKTGRKTALIMSMSMLALVAIGMVSKDVVERPRPTIPQSSLILEPDHEFSYPSGHAVIVSSGATLALVLFRCSTKKTTISLLLAVEAAFVCFSRVYVGAHYPLDIVGGILLGTGVSFLFVWKEKTLIKLYLIAKDRILQKRD
jgi:membrane-associated phospholipid phosphatase